MADEKDDRNDELPTTEELEEPSTEKEPGEEPKGGTGNPEADHQAVGIGVINSSSEPEPSQADTNESETAPTARHSDDADADADPPTDAVTDEVRRSSADLNQSG